VTGNFGIKTWESSKAGKTEGAQELSGYNKRKSIDHTTMGQKREKSREEQKKSVSRWPGNHQTSEKVRERSRKKTCRPKTINRGLESNILNAKTESKKKGTKSQEKSRELYRVPASIR